MKRTQLLLVVLGVVLLLALFYMLLWSPRQDEIAGVRAETESLEAQTANVRAEIAALRAVRDEAPQIASELAALRSIVPSEPDLPSVLRQLQAAADEAGLIIGSITPARPVGVTAEGGPSGLASIATTVDIEGSYFQIVDFLRRLEDPAISPRGLLVNSLILSGDPDEYPVLRASLQGELFAILPVLDGATLDQPPTDDAAGGDVDVDVDVEVEDGADAGAGAGAGADADVDVDVEVEQ